MHSQPTNLPASAARYKPPATDMWAPRIGMVRHSHSQNMGHVDHPTSAGWPKPWGFTPLLRTGSSRYNTRSDRRGGRMLRQIVNHPHEDYLPAGLPSLKNAQTALPAIAKDAQLIAEIENAVRRVPTSHELMSAMPRDGIAAESVHLVLTSPPYWTLKEYRDTKGQLGHMPITRDF